MKPPAHYRAYWKLEDDQKELKDLSSRILLYYIQFNCDSNLERMEPLKKAAEWVGFTVEIVPGDVDYMFQVPDDQTPCFDEMRQKIRNIRRGNWESEVVQIASILRDYKSKAPRWFWQKWPGREEA